MGGVKESDALRRSRLELLGSAAAGIAHDLNNQFTLILNYLAAGDVSSAREAVARCASLTSGLLAYCRGESTPLRPVDPAALVRRFAASLHPGTGIRVRVEVEGEPRAVLADEMAIERALDNLTRNACAAMNGIGTIRFRVQPGLIEVEDSGPGIPAENLKRIFEPFFSTRGSGLGLAIVREVMRQHGGAVTVDSTVGKGAKFSLHLRRAA